MLSVQSTTTSTSATSSSARVTLRRSGSALTSTPLFCAATARCTDVTFAVPIAASVWMS